MGGQGHERPHKNRRLSCWAGTCGVRVGIAPLIKPPRGVLLHRVTRSFDRAHKIGAPLSPYEIGTVALAYTNHYGIKHYRRGESGALAAPFEAARQGRS